MKRYIFILILAGLSAGAAVYLYTAKTDTGTVPEKSLPIPPEIYKRDMTLYFSSKNEEYLVPEMRQVSLNGSIESQIADLVKELIIGSKDLINIMPEGVKINGVRIEKNGILYIDFNKELRDNHPKGSWAEMMTLYSIVNTVTKNFPDIKRVRILIEGRETDTLTGHIDTRKPLTENMEIVRK
ncbi:MAG: GerMN domain-containing protein [Nitrospinae bacterium]|nr:GerMN domain-containing protein [Nitrospinota bacterium]